MAREQQRIGSTNLYTARALTWEYATWRDQPQLVPTAEGVLKTIRALTRPRGFESHALRLAPKTGSDLGLCPLISGRRLVTDRSQMQPTAAICRWARDISGMDLEASPQVNP
jgi:hypothetical protein